MRMVPRKDVPKVTSALFEFYVSKGSNEELRGRGRWATSSGAWACQG